MTTRIKLGDHALRSHLLLATKFGRMSHPTKRKKWYEGNGLLFVLMFTDSAVSEIWTQRDTVYAKYIIEVILE